MENYLEKFQNDPDNFAVNTKETYYIGAKQYLEWVTENQLDWLSPETINRWFDYLIVQGAQLSTLHLKRAALRYFFLFCFEEEFISEIPAVDVELDTVILDKKPIMTDAEVISLCESTESVRDRAIIQCMVDSGLRSTEFCKLDKIDVDLNAPKMIIAPGKNRRAREIPLTYESAALIKEYLDTRTDSDPALFITRLGKRFTRQGLHKLFKTYLRLSGIEENYSCHSCRWRFGTKLADNDFTLQEIAGYLGHLSLKSAKHYVNKDEDKQAANHHRFYQD